MTRSSLSLSVLVLALAAVAPVLVSACTPTHAAASRPSDDDLRALQSAHAVELDELRDAMIAEPSIDVLGDDHVGDCWKEGASWSCGQSGAIVLEDEMLTHVGLSKERHARMTELLHHIGATRVSRGADGDVSVIVYRSGIVTSPRTKGLVWHPERAPSPLVADTDEGRPARYATSYAHGAPASTGWFVEHTGD
jgi:hypothetical protein